jgi:D-xylose 1-dehydrogenase (NADP+, D-xylono-1,5-lactone-forming)
MEALRWGIVGAARIAREQVIPAVRRSGCGEVVAVSSASGRAGPYAEELAIPRSYRSHEELLADPDVDAVYLPLPNSEHARWIIRAAQAGKHVLCEKPLAVDAAAADAAIAACAAAGVLLMEAAMYRFHPRMQRLHELVTSGALGAPRLIHAAYTFTMAAPQDYRREAAMGGGALLDVGYYGVSIARWLAGAEPLTALSCAEREAEGAVDWQLAGVLRFPAGLAASVQCSFGAVPYEMVEVVGTAGVARVLRGSRAQKTDPVELRWQRGSDDEIDEQFAADQYAEMVEHFSHCILAGEPPAYAARDAAANLRALDALARAAVSGRAEAI